MLQRVALPSPCYSSRQGASVRLIVLHTAEGAQTYQSLGAFFKNGGNQVSSHVGIDDTKNVVGEYVNRSQKAWTAAAANPVAVQAELCAFARWSAADWAQHQNMLANAAQWIAEESKAFGIPIVKLTDQQAQSTGRGVAQHVQLGGWGGGHHDCGPAFPIDEVLRMARGQEGSAQAPAPTGTFPRQPPPFPGRVLALASPLMKGQDVRTWQETMRQRKWAIDVDGIYGPKSRDCCSQFQRNKHLTVDGQVGPETWAATWNTGVS